MNTASEHIREARESLIKARRYINSPEEMPTKVDITLGDLESVLTQLALIAETVEDD